MNRLVKIGLSALMTFALIDTRDAVAQTSSVQARTQAIVASFNKSKHVVKEKRGVRFEKYKEVRSAAAIKSNVRDYAGSYEADGMGLTFDLAVDGSGNVTANGYERVNMDSPLWRGFTLRNARFYGALLTGTKVYADGRTE